MTECLVDRIYEAAFLPDVWSDVIARMAVGSGMSGGALVVCHGDQVQSRQTPELDALLGEVCSPQNWPQATMAVHMRNAPPSAFVYGPDHFPKDVMRADFMANRCSARGMGSIVTTVLALPTFEAAILTLEQPRDADRPDDRMIAWLDALRPHLARAAMIAAKLHLEQARNTVRTLARLGLPAAVIDRRGRLLGMNDLMDGHLVPLTDDRFCFGDVRGDALLKARFLGENDVASIPLKPTDRWPGRVAHLVPVCGAARDVFSGSMSFLLINTASPSPREPDLTILRALFDLTPAEAGLASRLATGSDLKTAAAVRSIRFSTARSYLENIFMKTGCRRQTELVALLVGLTAGPRDETRAIPVAR